MERLSRWCIRKGEEEKDIKLLSPFPAAKMFALNLSIFTLIIVLAVPLFFLLPRISLAIYRRPGGRTRLLSGFSERVELGAIGTIKELDTLVMRVKLGKYASNLPNNLKWRGIALDHYDGRSWSRFDSSRETLFSQPQRPHTGSTQPEYFQIEGTAFSTNILEQTFYLEPLATDVLFASYKVKAVSREFGLLQQDSSGNLFAALRAYGRFRYKAVSDLTIPDPDLIMLRPDLIPDAIRTCCLQLPSEDPRVASLSKDVTSGITNAFGKARAIENYLGSHYGYSLELRGSPQNKDPLAMFLFDIRKGHCEYFATAMAIMLRQIGIPSRLVNGFRAGEYNRLADNWTVRQYDAHSWVEAYLPPYGWIEFDPTPPDPKRSRPGFARMISDVIDAVDLWWFEDVINYDFWRQIRLIERLRSQVVEMENRAGRFLAGLSSRGENRLLSASFRSWIFSPASLSLLIALPLIALTWFLGRRKRWYTRIRSSLRRKVHNRDHAIVITSFYAEALDMLHSHGFDRSRTQTSLEFAQSLSQHPTGTAIEALTRIYYRIRFGLSEGIEDRKAAEALLKSMREQLHRGKK